MDRPLGLPGLGPARPEMDDFLPSRKKKTELSDDYLISNTFCAIIPNNQIASLAVHSRDPDASRHIIMAYPSSTGITPT